MAKDESLYEDAGPRKELVRVIKEHIGKERLQDVLRESDKKRPDAIGHIVIDAVKRSPMVSFSGTPHVYSSKYGRYLPFDYHEFKTAIDDAMRGAGIPDGNYSRIGKLVNDAWSEVLCRKYMTDPSVVIMGNGVFDTMDMKLHPYSDRFMTNIHVPYEYNGNDLPVMWKRFLSRVLPDIGLQNLLQEFIAATFVDRRLAKIEYMLTLLGGGSNGKSVVFEVILALLGEDNVSTFSIRDLISSARSQQNVASCNGKRLNYCSEMRTTHIGEDNADAFKSLVSGEPMMARSLYREPFKASNIPLMMSNANRMPKLDDASYSLQRRMLIIPFDVLILEDEQDKELAVKLKGELPGIFNWVMEGLSRLRKNKYQITVPERVKILVAQYFTDSNPLTRWVDDARLYARCNKNTSSDARWAKLGTLFKKFDGWCVENGEPRITNRKFSDSLEMLGFIKSRRADGIGFTYYYAPSREDMIDANMDMALSMQSKQYLDYLKNAAESNRQPHAEGIAALERYLGVGEGTIVSYFSSGKLEGTYYKKGQVPVFDIAKVQMALSEQNFYAEMHDKNLKKGIGLQYDLRTVRRTFNAYMNNLGIPIRKFCIDRHIPNYLSGCIIVTDEWEYTPDGAREILECKGDHPCILKRVEKIK